MTVFQNETVKPHPVLFGVESVGAHELATVELNRPEVLNALDSDCYKLLEERLPNWQSDARIGAVVISGKGGRAFCAGGDVKGLILKLKEFGIEIAREFFTREYFVDGLIHKFKKPVIAICDGITMGGGLGLAAGAIFRVATERTMVAMPELSIGLFPDVGATRFLHSVRAPFGLFLGLTGARIMGADAVRIGLMDALVPSATLRHLHADLLRALANEPKVEMLRAAISRTAEPHDKRNGGMSGGAMTIDDEHLIEDLFSHDNLLQIHQAFMRARKLSPWLEETRERYVKGSALSRAVFFAAYQRHRDLSIIETLTREWEMSLHFSKGREFLEGVRAVLIDKDHSPRWTYPDLDSVPDEAVEAAFSSSDERNLLAEKFREFGL